MWHRTQQSATAAAGTRQYLAGCLLGGMRCANTTTSTTTTPMGGGARWASSVGGGGGGSTTSSSSSVPSTTAFGFKDFTASASSYGASDAAKASQQRKAEASPDALAALLSNPAVARKVVLGLSESARRRLTMMASRQEWEMDHTNDTPPTPPKSTTNTKSTTSSTTTTATNNNTPSFNASGASLSGSRQTLKAAERVRGSGCGKGGSREDEELTMNNGDVTAVEHREWARQAVSRRATGGTGSARDINWRVLLKIGLQTACPFIAFGMLDNSLLVLSGDLIDSLLGERLDLSGMGAAAMGGIVSGTVGIQMHGLADRMVQKYGPSRPRLTPQEWRMSKTKKTIHWCGTLGLILGLSLGMFPLYFID